MGKVSNSYDNMKLAWEGLTFGQKASMVAGVVVPVTIVSFLIILFMGGDSNEPSIGSNRIQNQNIDTVRQPLNDGADENTVSNRYVGEANEAERSLAGGGSFMPTPDLRSSLADQPQTPEVQPAPVQNQPQPTLSYVDAIRSQESTEPAPTPAAPPVAAEPARENRASERLSSSIGGTQQNVASEQYSGLSREQYTEYVEGEVDRLAGIFSTRRSKINSLYAVAPTGQYSVSNVEALKEEEPVNRISSNQNPSQANVGSQGGQGEQGRMLCMLCPGDRITARIDRDIDSRYTSNIELTIVQGQLEGARVFGSFRMVNEEAILKSQSRLVLTTDNITQDRRVAQFPAVIVDLESGSQVIDQEVKNYTIAKFLAVASTSIARRWSDLTVANATTQRIEDPENVTQQQNLSDEMIWQASGGWALAEFNDIARRWYNSAPVITIPKNELVSIMIVEPVQLGWIDHLEQGEDYL
jgi:hypothetical protein